MGCVTAATQNGFTRAGLTLLLPRIGTFASLHGWRDRCQPSDVASLQGCSSGRSPGGESRSRDRLFWRLRLTQ
jgi:hypothetical protein